MVFKDYPLDKKQSKKVKHYLIKRNLESLWKCIDSFDLKLPDGDETEVIASHVGIFVRVWNTKV